MIDKVSYPRLSKDRLLRMLTEAEVEDLHSASLDILQQIGISTNSKRIIGVFNDNGADVDPNTNLVRIPSRLVTDALKSAPKEVKLYGRNPKHDMILEDGRVYFGFGGTPLSRILDMETGKPRPSTKQDVADAARVGDALPNMGYIMSICGAFDVPSETEYLHELEAVFTNTEKHVVWAVPGAYTAKNALTMAASVVGGLKELRKRPILSCYSESISPLTFSSMNEDMIEFAEAGVPVFFTGCPMVGLTGPATIAGTYVLANAETLSALTLSQLVNPGTPFIYGPGVGVADLRTLRFSFGAPEWAMGHILQSQLASFYGLPTFGWGGSSDSKCVDSQAGAEAAITALMSALSGINMIHCTGYLAGSEYGSMEMAVICDEIAGMVFRIIEGAHVTQENLALDLIREVGPRGNFLTRKHTIANLRKEIFVPKLFDRNSEPAWTKSGAKGIYQVAKERVRSILREHSAEPLTQDVKKELANIVKKADDEIATSKG